MGKTGGDSEYPIAAVSKLTGVSCHALRVWERRYGFPVPHRSASGHRRYSHEQVQVLRQLAELARSGRSIGDLIDAYRAGSLAIEADPVAPEAPGAAECGEFLDRMLAGDFAGGVATFERLESRLSPDALLERVITPALTETGDRWFHRKCTVYQEHCISGFLRRKLGAMTDAARRDNPAPAHTVIVGTVQGDRHEGGILIVNLLLERAGWRAINLGVDLPATEYARAVDDLRPDALALSFVLSRNINKRFQELAAIRSVPVFVGGRSILNYQNLARRNGLIPLAGPAAAAVAQLFREHDQWRRRQVAPPTAC